MEQVPPDSDLEVSGAKAESEIWISSAESKEVRGARTANTTACVDPGVSLQESGQAKKLDCDWHPYSPQVGEVQS